MSVAYYIVLDQEIPGLDADTDGQAFAKHYPALDALALRLGQPEIDTFVSIDDEDLAALLGDEAAALGEVGDEDDVSWHSAQAGVVFFSALADHLRIHPEAVSDASGVLADLDNYIRVLQAAAPHDAHFFLGIDF